MAGAFVLAGVAVAVYLAIPPLSRWHMSRQAAKIMADVRANPSKHIDGWDDWEKDHNARFTATMSAIDRAIQKAEADVKGKAKTTPNSSQKR